MTHKTAWGLSRRLVILRMSKIWTEGRLHEQHLIINAGMRQPGTSSTDGNALQGTGFSDHCFKGVSLYGKGKERKTKTVENRAGDLLTKLGFKANLKGVVYLKAAARIGLEDREELEGVTKRLYPAIAKECRTCAGRVEHAIRHAIHTSWEKGDVRQQRMVFGYDRESGNRPTNAEFIARMIDCLERQDHLLYS